MIRVLITDDDKLFRDGLCVFLRRHSDLEVVGQAGDGKAAVDLIPTLQPHVVLMDVEMPMLDGIEATRRIQRLEHKPGILIVAGSFERTLVEAALQSGARGYIAKHEFISELIPGVRAVAAGQTYFSHSIGPLPI